jgi:hypothetical protein
MFDFIKFVQNLWDDYLKLVDENNEMKKVLTIISKTKIRDFHGEANGMNLVDCVDRAKKVLTNE